MAQRVEESGESESVSRELLEQRVKPAIEAFLTARGLQLAPEKTLITHIPRGFDFLGQNVRKYGDKLLIKPARRSVNALLKKVSEVLGRNKAATQAQVILLLNPIILVVRSIDNITHTFIIAMILVRAWGRRSWRASRSGRRWY